MARVCIESCFSIIAPRGNLADGRALRLVWQRGGVVVTCTLRAEGSGWALDVAHNYCTPAVQRVALVSTPAHFGGVRRWFLCPGCGSRAARLHLPGRYQTRPLFLCRRCHDLTYESSQSSRTFARSFFLLRAIELRCSYREARDEFRALHEAGGAHFYRPRELVF